MILVNRVIIVIRVIPPTQKTSKPFLARLVVVIHVCPATTAPRNGCARPLGVLQGFIDGTEEAAGGHPVSIVQGEGARHICI